MSEKTAKAKEAVSEAAEELSATLGEEVREELRAGAEDLSERAQEGLQELESLIKAHPLQSTLIAFGLGFMLSRLLSR
ncbi:MAG: hypothetical protein Q7T44_04060 [Parvibaculum sp.]|nr:hypothetical protein [Parvibaculum sp.]